MTEQPAPYPVQFSIDYPESSRRLTVLFRIVLAIPILILFTLVNGAAAVDDSSRNQWAAALVTGGIVWLPALLMILFRRKYPRWWFDWNLELTRFWARVNSYLLLLRDDYPSTDEPQGVHLDIQYPDAQGELNRFLPLVKWILAIPHYIVLSVVWKPGLAGDDHRLVRDPDRRPLPEGAFPVRRRNDALELPGRGLRLPPHHRPVPALPLRPIAAHRLETNHEE